MFQPNLIRKFTFTAIKPSGFQYHTTIRRTLSTSFSSPLPTYLQGYPSFTLKPIVSRPVGFVSAQRSFATNRRPGNTLFAPKTPKDEPHVVQEAPPPPQQQFYQQQQQPPQPQGSNLSWMQTPPAFPPRQQFNFSQLTNTQQQQQQQPGQLKWWQQPNNPPQPPNEFFRKHPILFQVFQVVLSAIGITIAFSLFR